jgi:hypothetical protein
MNSIRLANVIFDMGEKLSQSKYELICEDIRSDRFTLSEHVCAYKKLDMVAGKNAYRIDKNKLTTFMSQSEKNFKSVLRTIIDGRTESNC